MQAATTILNNKCNQSENQETLNQGTKFSIALFHLTNYWDKMKNMKSHQINLGMHSEQVHTLGNKQILKQVWDGAKTQAQRQYKKIKLMI